MNRAKGLAKAAPWWWRFKDWMNLQKTKTSFPEETYSPYHISIYEIYTLYSNIYIYTYICIVIYYDRIFIVWERLSSWMWISFLANSQAFYLIIRDTIYFTTPGLPITIAEIRQISFASDMIWRCFAKIWNWSRHCDSLMTMRVTGWEMGLDYSDIQLRTFITGSRLHFKKSISSSLWIFLTGIAESLRSLDHFKHWKGPCTNFSSRYQEQFRSILCFDVSYFFQHPSNFHLLHAGFVWPWLIWGGDQPIGFLPLSFRFSDKLVMSHHSLLEHGTREMIGYEKLCHGSMVNPLKPQL